MRLGVIGTFVWDVIHGRHANAAPVTEWGGITYSLAGLDAALPADWEIVPIMKVGSDLGTRANEFIRTLKRIAPDAALIEVPYANNRVELRYISDERRTETLTGGVPGWSWIGLKPAIDISNLDALYVNFLSGWELGGILSAQSGAPFTVTLQTDQARTGDSRVRSTSGGQRPDFNPAAGCTVNAVNPGPTDTGWGIGEEDPNPAMPLGRWGEPDDAARLIAWLCTDDARWITGQVIDSEGGFRRWAN